jgi:dienelactone hydrolase
MEPVSFAAQVNEYNLGDTTILQDHFPEDSRFRHMPARLDGVVGAPDGPGPYPVVLIMHGSHPACLNDEVWPCTKEEEQPNYAGFAYLVEALAEAGYVALSINVNAEHTFAFGEAPPAVRTKQLIDAHLAELAAAAAGESSKFGLDLSGRVDLSRMVWVGHSRGGDFVNRLVRENNLHQTASDIGYGPVEGLLFLAPPIMSTDVLPAVDVPSALILPTCDWDVGQLAGQLLYESARFDPDRQEPFTSVYLQHGNHNSFNTVLAPDPIIEDRPDCVEGSVLQPEEQQEFLAQYVVDFVRAIYATPDVAGPARQRLGLASTTPLPTELFDRPVQITTLQPAGNYVTVMKPLGEEALSLNLLGGQVTLDGMTAVFCPEGYYIPADAPGTEPCQRVNFNQPGYPQLIALSWDSGDAAWRTTLPDSGGDLSGYEVIQVRAALDPLSGLNAEGEPLSFSIELVDGNGGQAEVSGLDLEYPPGVRQPNDFFEGDRFTGHVTMHTVRIPLQAFGDIDTSNIAEIALIFNQTPSGALFVADLEAITQQQ